MAVTNYTISVSTTQVDTKVEALKGYVLINDGAADVFWTDDRTKTVSTSGAGLKTTDPPLSVNDATNFIRAKTSSGTATLRVWALK